MRILLDVTRTLVHSKKRTPTGIDRVEHAYIRYLLQDQSGLDPWFIANTPFGRGALSRRQMRGIFSEIEATHQTAAAPEASESFRELVTALAVPVDSSRMKPLSICRQTIRDRDSRLTVARAFVQGAFQFSRLLRAKKPSVYLHTSHLQLDEPNCFDWLDKPFLFPVFFIHDLIPVEYPEYCSPGAAERHQLRIETTMKHARALLVNSAFTRNSLAREAGSRPLPPTAVVPLANTIRDASQSREHMLLPSVPFFVHVGTIEGRKNIGHLLNVWRQLIQRMGPTACPRLVLIGKRGWECEGVISALERSRELSGHVIEVSNMTDWELQMLMLGSAGLITVSMTEGYGLPPVEAAQLGVPVIASDIPAHREILGNTCDFVAPHDGEALLAKIMLLATQGRRPGTPKSKMKSFSWNEHVEEALCFVKAQIQPAFKA